MDAAAEAAVPAEHSASKRARQRYPKSKDGCIQCRASKKKCDLAKPSCSSCLKRSLGCTWSDFPGQTLKAFLEKHNYDSPEHFISRKCFRNKGSCLRCKTWKKKCDQNRPSCARCVKSGAECTWVVDDEDGSENENENENELGARKPKSVPFFFNDAFHNEAELEAFLSMPDELTDSFASQFNLFFNKIIKNIVPARSISVLSEIELESFEDNESFRKVFSFFCNAYAFSSNPEKQPLVESLYDETMEKLKNDSNLVGSPRSQLLCVIFTILGLLYHIRDNSKLILEVQKAWKILENYHPETPSAKFKVLVESFIFHFSASILLTPIEYLKQYDVFAICERLRNYFPLIPTEESNPLLGPNMEVYIIKSKVSFLFKSKSYDFQLYQNELEKVNRLLLTRSIEETNDYDSFDCENLDSNSIDLFLYIDVIAIKLLILHCLPYQDNSVSTKITNEVISKLSVFKNYKESQDIRSSWGLFMLGLSAEEEQSRKLVIKFMEFYVEKKNNLPIQKLIQVLESAWNLHAGYEILRDSNFTSGIWLN